MLPSPADEAGGSEVAFPAGSFASAGADTGASGSACAPGTVPLVSGGCGRRQIGRVRVRATAVPPPPPPTVVRFGDVGVAPAGCPMCPVVDDQVSHGLYLRAHTIPPRIEITRRL